MSRPIQSFLSLAALATFVALSACVDSRFPEPFYISAHPAIDVIDGPGRYVLNAQCPSGQQLLGGAYYQPDGDAMLQLGVTADYPSSTSTWTVIFENPDNGRAHLLDGTVLTASAYCLATPDYPINSTIVSSNQSTSTESSFFRIEALDAYCPTGAVVTGGGFTTGVSGENSNSFNANLFVSAPTMGPSEKADGWQVALSYLPQDVIPTTTVYVLCAQQNLVAGPMVVEALDLTTLSSGWGWSESSATCPRNTFTTGGGYSLIGDLLIPHQVSSVGARSQYSTWKNLAAFGFQSSSSSFRPCDPSVNPDCAKSAALAACVEIPNIPFVHVEIVEPGDGDSFGPVPPNDSSTAPITFVANASAEDGTPLTGSALQWFQDDIPFGSGESFTATLPAGRDKIDFIKIRVTATGATTSASDEITISVGIID